MTDICEICGSGPIFAGNAMEFGLIVDLYHRCACPDPTDDDYPDFDVPVVDFDPRFNDARYQGI